MAANDKQKQSLYFPDDMLREIMREANRLDRSLSWIVQQAWRVARDDVRKFPSVEVRGETQPAPSPTEPSSGGDDPRPASLQVREFIRGKFDSEAAS